MTTHSVSLAIVGDGSVGKSTIILAFRTDGFMPVYKQTIGVDFYEKQIKLRGDSVVQLRVWDIGGQSIQSKNLASYLSPANAVIVVYDVTNPESFANLDDWIMQTRKYNQTKFIYLVANKVDLIAARQISSKQHESYIDNNDLMGGIFVSAKTGENVVKMFYKIAGDITGQKLGEYELAFYDKVLTAQVHSSEDNEIRNPWADQIEKEDMEAEMKKQNKKANCILS